MPFDIFKIIGLVFVFLVCWLVGFFASRLNGLRINIVHSSFIGLVSIVFGFIIYTYTEEGLKNSSSIVLFIVSTTAIAAILIYFTTRKKMAP